MLAILLNTWRRIREWSVPSPEDRVVLIFEPFALGDIISLEPLVRVLAAHDYKVRICSKAHWQPLIPSQNVDHWLNEYTPWTTYDTARKYKLKLYLSANWWRFLKNLRGSGRGSIGIDCRGDIRSVILLHLAGCREVLTLSHYVGSDLETPRLAATRVTDDGTLRRWELNLEFAHALGISRTETVAPPDLRHLAPQQRGRNPSVVGLVAVAPWPGRLWPKRNWQALIPELRSLGLQPIGFHGPGQAAQAREMLGEGVELVQASSVADWARKLESAGLVISLDSGPMHLADALGIPVVGLFGSGKLPLWAPSGNHSCTVHHQDRPGFYPCHQVDQNIALGQQYMDWVQVEDVLAAVKRRKTEALKS